MCTHTVPHRARIAGTARGCGRLRDDEACRRLEATTNDNPLMSKGKAMAEQDETHQEKVTRWTAQRAAHEKQQDAYRAARRRTTGRHWVIGGAIVLIVVVIAAAVLL